MRAASAARLVLERELHERLRSRLFWLLTALTALGLVALIVVPAVVRKPAKPTVIGLVGTRAQALRPTLERTATAAKVAVDVVSVGDARAARSVLESRTIDVALLVGASSARAEVRTDLSPTIGALLRATLDAAHLRTALREAGVSAASIASASAPMPFASTALHPAPPHKGARQAAALVAGLLLYLSLGVYGAAVANGVAQEKTSRTAEVLLAAVRPRQLLVGKVTGIGLVGLGQLAVAVCAGLVANAVVHRAEIPGTVWRLLPEILLWFLLGFALYAFAMAAAGALVARQEEVQFVTLPVGLPLIAGFLLVYAAIASPSAWWIAALSLLPPFAPSLMPARIALGHTPVWQVALAALLTLGAVWVLARVAARIYAPALVRGGARIGWREALELREE